MKKDLIYSKSTSQWTNIIDEWIHDRTDRQIMKLKILDSLSFSQIEDVVPLSIDHIKTRYYKAEKYLQLHL